MDAGVPVASPDLETEVIEDKPKKMPRANEDTKKSEDNKEKQSQRNKTQRSSKKIWSTRKLARIS